MGQHIYSEELNDVGKDDLVHKAVLSDLSDLFVDNDLRLMAVSLIDDHTLEGYETEPLDVNDDLAMDIMDVEMVSDVYVEWVQYEELYNEFE